MHECGEGEDHGEDCVGREGGAVAVDRFFDGAELWGELVESGVEGKDGGRKDGLRKCNLRRGRSG